MSDINISNRSNFFPNSSEAKSPEKIKGTSLERNDPARKKHLDEISKNDAQVKISDAVRDFSRIKKAVDAAPEVDNRRKIEALKEQINNGTYRINYDSIADKLLNSEF